MSIRRLIPNLFTAGNMIAGVLAIIFSLSGHLIYAPFCIFIAAIFDFLDGFIARKLKVDGPLGKQLDSLADMVTFGVAPGIILFCLFDPTSSGMLDYLKNCSGDANVVLRYNNEVAHSAIIESSGSSYSIKFFTPFKYVALVVPFFALFRLAKFNIDDRQSENFIGLPTPAMTLFFAGIPLMCMLSFASFEIQFVLTAFILDPYVLLVLTLGLSYAMVAELPLFSLKFKSFGWKGNEIRYIFLTISVVMLATLFWWALPLIILLYVILSLIDNLFKKSAKDEIQS